ncbi:aspartyl/asparaginyl beta-hydroxylase domain-containing protein [Niabella sp. W65]|nr:aspartyl/asparaginyl beta-hydroxylase domain-containing protein [Niabella sp. W65]MCH7362602.1 aspartyl/asparaginyl beta-hydroxylase domain-containing protein [Niabella sp. W65]ULT38553.1 aspartyl/asparaginyl beta-hydroxylase domain-containing protein [Niabella sp. I65]
MPGAIGSFLNLKAGACIKPHRDRELAFEMGEARLHFPIITNPDVAFFVEDHQLNMQAGECWYINANLTHHVSNNGKTDRVHLVIDCLVNEWLRELFSRAVKHTKADIVDVERQKQIVEALRLQNTPLQRSSQTNWSGNLAFYNPWQYDEAGPFLLSFIVNNARVCR